MKVSNSGKCSICGFLVPDERVDFSPTSSETTLATALSKIVHDAVNVAPHDIGLQLVEVVRRYFAATRSAEWRDKPENIVMPILHAIKHEIQENPAWVEGVKGHLFDLVDETRQKSSGYECAVTGFETISYSPVSKASLVLCLGCNSVIHIDLSDMEEIVGKTNKKSE